MQSSSGESNEHEHYSLSYSDSQTVQYYDNLVTNTSNQSSIPGLRRLVSSHSMGLPSIASSGVQGASGHSAFLPGSAYKRPANDAAYMDYPKCETANEGEKYTSPHSTLSPHVAESKSIHNSLHTPLKKTKGRVKIKMEFIDNKLRRYTTFSKRKTGIMKKAYELSTLTGTQVMLLVASETGHVYTFATRKLQPMITSEAGKALIQTCLNSPDQLPGHSGLPGGGGGGVGGCGAGGGGSGVCGDQRMSATGFEETELVYNIGGGCGAAAAAGAGLGASTTTGVGDDDEQKLSGTSGGDDEDDDEEDSESEWTLDGASVAASCSAGAPQLSPHAANIIPASASVRQARPSAVLPDVRKPGPLPAYTTVSHKPPC